MTPELHPFDRVPMPRIEQAHPRFLIKLDISALRRNVERQRARVNLHRAQQHLGKRAG